MICHYYILYIIIITIIIIIMYYYLLFIIIIIINYILLLSYHIPSELLETILAPYFWLDKCSPKLWVIYGDPSLIESHNTSLTLPPPRPT